MEIEMPFDYVALQVHEAAFRVNGPSWRLHHGVSGGNRVFLAFAALSELEAYEAKYADEIELESVETKFVKLAVYR